MAHLYVLRHQDLEAAGTARLPSVLVLHTSDGPGLNLEALAKRLAAEGTRTAAPTIP